MIKSRERERYNFLSLFLSPLTEVVGFHLSPHNFAKSIISLLSIDVIIFSDPIFSISSSPHFRSLLAFCNHFEV